MTTVTLYLTSVPRASFRHGRGGAAKLAGDIDDTASHGAEVRMCFILAKERPAGATGVMGAVAVAGSNQRRRARLQPLAETVALVSVVASAPVRHGLWSGLLQGEPLVTAVEHHPLTKIVSGWIRGVDVKSSERRFS